jgi:CheY-like chemotaxis protein
MRKLILLVEDDYIDAISFERSLKKLNVNHEVHIARNGRDALDMLQGKGAESLPGMPDLVVLDLNMPKMSGLEFLEAIRDDHHLRDLKVYVTSTTNDEEDATAAKKLGVSGFIIKPLNFDGKAAKNPRSIISASCWSC